MASLAQVGGTSGDLLKEDASKRRGGPSRFMQIF